MEVPGTFKGLAVSVYYIIPAVAVQMWILKAELLTIHVAYI